MYSLGEMHPSMVLCAAGAGRENSEGAVDNRKRVEGEREGRRMPGTPGCPFVHDHGVFRNPPKMPSSLSMLDRNARDPMSSFRDILHRQHQQGCKVEKRAAISR